MSPFKYKVSIVNRVLCHTDYRLSTLSLERIDKLLNYKTDLTLISEDYFEKLSNPDLLILQEYQNIDKHQPILQPLDSQNLAYDIDELTTSNNNDSYTTNNYYLVANNITYNLLKNKV